MNEGFIPTPGLRWIPKGDYIGKQWFRGPKEKEGFRIGRIRWMSYREQPAWYCPNCDLIIIDCKAVVD